MSRVARSRHHKSASAEGFRIRQHAFVVSRANGKNETLPILGKWYLKPGLGKRAISIVHQLQGADRIPDDRKYETNSEKWTDLLGQDLWCRLDHRSNNLIGMGVSPSTRRVSNTDNTARII